MMRAVVFTSLLLFPSLAIAEGYSECQRIELYALNGQKAQKITIGDFYKILKDKLDVLLVGERHGVKAHPRIIACLLAEAGGKGTSFLVEMLNADQQAVIDRHRKMRPELFGKIINDLKWWETGWPSWSVYAPMFDVAWLSRSELIGADMPKGHVVALDAAYASVASDNIKNIEAGWAQSMFEAHCKLISENEAAQKGQFQMQRDAFMAERITNAALETSKVLFYGGRAHVREDRGLVQLVRYDLKGLNVATLALKERDLGKLENHVSLLSSYQGKYNFVGFIGEHAKKGLC